MMMKNILLLAVVFLAPSIGFAQRIRRRDEQINDNYISSKIESTVDSDFDDYITVSKYNKVKGQKTVAPPPSITDLTERVDKLRNLKGHDRYGGLYDEYAEDMLYHSKKSKKKKKGKYGRKRQRQPKCRKVVEPVEFYMEPPIATVFVPQEQSMNLTVPNPNVTTTGMTTMPVNMQKGNPQELGTRWVFNGPLLAYSADKGITDLPGFFASGVCTRTWINMADAGIPGASYCNLALSIDTGASVVISGEVFDGWDSNLGVEGGTREMMGVSGQIALSPLDRLLAPLELSYDIFEDSYLLRGRGTLIYSICPDRFWNRAYTNFQNLGSSDEGAYPNPFELEENSNT